MKKLVSFFLVLAVVISSVLVVSAKEYSDAKLTALLEERFYGRNEPLNYNFIIFDYEINKNLIIKNDQTTNPSTITYPVRREYGEGDNIIWKDITMTGTFEKTRYYSSWVQPTLTTENLPNQTAKQILQGNITLYETLQEINKDNTDSWTIEIKGTDGGEDITTGSYVEYNGHEYISVTGFFYGHEHFSTWARRPEVLSAIQNSGLNLEKLQVVKLENLDYFVMDMVLLYDGEKELIWCPDYVYEPDGPVADEFRVFTKNVIKEGLYPVSEILEAAITTTQERNDLSYSAISDNPLTGR